VSINATLLAQILVFGILIWVTMKFLWPPLMEAMEKRAKHIADGLAASERAQSELKDADARVAAEIKKARVQASGIIDTAQQQANQILEKARADAVVEINRHKAMAEDEIASMAQRAREQLRHEVGALAIKGAERIVQREIDPGVHKALLDQLMAEI
jgi:F-type H+-transporting ATPase subunit b